MPRKRERESRRAEATRLRRLRRALGMTQRELAEELRVGPSAVALWESAGRTMPGPVLRLLELYEEELSMSEPEPCDEVGEPGWALSTSRMSRGWALTRGFVRISRACGHPDRLSVDTEIA